MATLLKQTEVRKTAISGLTHSALALYYAAVAKTVARPAVFIMRDADEAGYMYQDLNALLPNVMFFPSSYKRAIKFGQRDAANAILRTEALTALSQYQTAKPQNHTTIQPQEGGGLGGAFFLIVTYPSAIAELVISQKNLDTRHITLQQGDITDITALQRQLRDMDFREVDYVYEPGQFAVRGSIIDVYSYSNEQPFRIDFFDNEIDSLRLFNVEDQLSMQRLQQIDIVPEISKTDTDKVPFFDFLPAETLLFTHDMQYVTDAIDYIYKDGFTQQALTERLETASEMDKDAIRRELNASLNLLRPTLFQQVTEPFSIVTFGNAVPSLNAQTTNSLNAQTSLQFNVTPQPPLHKNFELLASTFLDYQLQDYRTCILSDSDKQHERLSAIMEEMKTEWTPVKGSIHEGFIDHDLKIVFFTDHQIFERFHKYQLKGQTAKKGKMALTMKELQEMEPGDFIVHVDFGIGKFGGLVRIPVPEKPQNLITTKPQNLITAKPQNHQEVIRIIYQHNAIVDVSIHSLYKISKYRRADTGEPPRLSTLGTGAWDRIKERAKKRIKDIARDLIKLYAKRRHEKGFAFAPDSYLQHELEGSFLYEDTPDQIKATQEVKHDMEAARPMDRLVCGDVGFGKTEVAIRAAFKAACDSKQVAVLVPTTVLAFQHYKTFSKRMSGLPVRIDYLTRARTPKQTKQVQQDLADGKIDILVGTHRMLTKAIKWKDIGLLIIDEEQKFGVSTKEKLRQLKTNIDTLTMSATPIPRTLQFSLMGARDMSIMRTPPPNRQPIDTQVATFSAELVTDAINFEMSRDGQVYFVCHRVATLEKMRTIIERNIPDCRVAIGHGQMKPEELENIILGFINYDYDVLLATTIVENGIDVPNANTIIINDANHFGLSDLHQMRGRVGRSNRKAYCYLLAPPLAYLPTESRRRLEALETFADLGSGFSLALQDLDIRGAGNLLGSEQSGFMEDLGYETYQKILTQAVNELKSEEFQELYEEQMAEGEDISGEHFVDDCSIDSDLQLYFPDTYVPGSSERMILYRELDSIHNDTDLEAYRKKLEDRFGPVPEEGEELIRVVLLRRIGRRLGCERIILKQHIMQMQFVSNNASPFYDSAYFIAIQKYIMTHPKYCKLSDAKGVNRLSILNVKTVKEAISILKHMLPEK